MASDYPLIHLNEGEKDSLIVQHFGVLGYSHMVVYNFTSIMHDTNDLDHDYG
jgi:hypothetical protein